MLTSEIFPSKKFVQSEIRVREIEYTVQSFSISSSNISSSATAMISGHKERLGGGQRMAGRIREAGRSSAWFLWFFTTTTKISKSIVWRRVTYIDCLFCINNWLKTCILFFGLTTKMMGKIFFSKEKNGYLAYKKFLRRSDCNDNFLVWLRLFFCGRTTLAVSDCSKFT